MVQDGQPIVEVSDLAKHFPVRRGVIPHTVGHIKAVDGVSFTIKQGEVLGLAGESGSGKSTIGRSILRLIDLTAGQLRFRGDDITTIKGAALRRFRKKAQIVFQDPFSSLDPRMTIERIVGEPLDVQGLVSNRRARRDRVVELLDIVALDSGYLPRKPDQLSGGQRQRVGIARALAVEPEFLVADEPVSALDVSIQAQVVNLLDDLRERFHLAMLFISHDIAVMEHLSHRIAVVYLGKIMEIGASNEITGAPKHPYTEALLSAVPEPNVERMRKRIVLEGDMPSPASPPSGCVFRTRCPYAVADCARIVPELREVAPGHAKACIRDDVL